MNEIKVTVRFYGIVADQVGSQEENISMPDKSSISDIINQRYLSKLRGEGQITACAINNQFSDENEIIHDGDVIDLMPPFAGG